MDEKLKTKLLVLVIILEIFAIGYLFIPESFRIESQAKLFINPPKIVFSFNQPIIRSSLEGDFQINPPVGGSFSWSDHNRQVVFKPYYLAYDEDYIVSVKSVRSYVLTELKEKSIKFKVEAPSSLNLANLAAISPIKLPISEKNVFTKPDGEAVIIEKPKTEGKYIDVDISDQIMTLYDEGIIKGVYEVSTGRYNMPTPLGTFEVLKKEENHWSKTYQLYMPFSLEFTTGFYIHELPYWPSGYREGLDHLGQRVSHGCIRLGIGAAKEVYDFAEIETPVIVHQ